MQEETARTLAEVLSLIKEKCLQRISCHGNQGKERLRCF